MNRLSVDCDCDSSPSEPDRHDIGILASFDPVAQEQACVDLVYASEDGQSLLNRIESRNGLHTLEQAKKLGLGSRAESEKHENTIFYHFIIFTLPVTFSTTSLKTFV